MNDLLEKQTELFCIICFESSLNFFKIYGNKGFAFVNSLPPAMRGAPGGTISGRRPLPEVPWPDGINLLSSLKPKSRDTPWLRAACVRQAETCEKSSAELFSVCSGTSQTAIETRIRRCRADMQSFMDMHLRANKQIQEYHAARAIRSKICSGCAHTKWLPPGRFSLSSFGRHGILESVYLREGACP